MTEENIIFLFIIHLQKRIAENARNEQLQKHVSGLNDALLEVVGQAQQTLNDPNAAPQSYEQLQQAVAEPVANAEKCCAVLEDEDARHSLSANILVAKEVQGRLVQRWRHWLEFVQQRDRTSAQLDSARKLLEVTERKPCRELSQVEADYENLKVGAIF